MKQKSNKSLKKRFTLSHPKNAKNAKVMHESPGFAHNIKKRRKFSVLKGKMSKALTNVNQARKISKAIS